MLQWEEEDRFSFDDSERFEDESDCSWLSEPESLCNNWRGWKKGGSNAAPITLSFHPTTKFRDKDGPIRSLAELSARTVAAQIPFEVVEQMMPVVPEQIQLWIAYWSFPDNEEDIRLYSCLANGNADEFIKGEKLYESNLVEEVLQIGFHLSATVSISNCSKGKCKVAVTFDRARITTCNCTCSSTASWCSHVVAVCLHRIRKPSFVKLRAPVSESLSRLQRDQLQKFAQYLISELPQQILPTAQRLIDEILSSQPSDINTVSGAPDPTAGASASEQTAWWLDENNLHDNIRKILVKFCVPSPMVFSDVNYLSSTAPPVASEWSTLLRPLRGREPEGMWNLLSIVREMFKRHDHNAIPLLEIITEECLATEKILLWWVNTRVALQSGSSGHGGKNNVNSNSHGSQYACSSLCDEIVSLWRLAALNPALSPSEREMLIKQFKDWHLKVMEKVTKSKEAASNATSGSSCRDSRRNGDMDIFPGFKPAVEACLLDWTDYHLPGITYSPAASRYYCPVMCCKHDPSHEPATAPITAPMPRMPPQFVGLKRPVDRKLPSGKNVTSWGPLHLARDLGIGGTSRSQRSSSVSSEGFCDNDLGRDSDSSHDQHSMEQDSGQVSRQNSREDRSCSNGRRRDCLLDNNYGMLRVSQRLNCNEDQGCSMEEMDADPKIPEDMQDDYRMYAYNPILVRLLEGNGGEAGAATAGERSSNHSNNAHSSSDKTDVFASIKKLEDSLEILFARAEGLHAHGHVQEASGLAVQLAEELLAHPPNLMIDIGTPNSKSRKKKGNPASHQLTCLASATLAKCAFLCSVLSEDPEHTHLAFKVAVFGLEMSRLPASTKPLEVKIANQESDLVALLKKLPLGYRELAVIREKAEQMRRGMYNTRGEALLPLMLASLAFDALIASVSWKQYTGNETFRHPGDEILGFEASVAALALKANISEADHPLLCEGTRRQRGDLGLTLLTFYKDDQGRLANIMDKFLDKEVHQMYKAPSLPTYYASHTSPQTQPPEGAEGGASVESNVPSGSSPIMHPSRVNAPAHTSAQMWVKNQNNDQEIGAERIDLAMGHLSLSPEAMRGARPKANPHRFPEGGDVNATARDVPPAEGGGVRGETFSWEKEFRDWDDKIKYRKKRGHPGLGAGAPCGGAAAATAENADSYANNMAQRGAAAAWMKQTGPGSDSGSSGNSSDSIGSLSSGDKGAADVHKPVESPPLGFPIMRPIPPHSGNEPITQTRLPIPFGKGVRYKGKRAYPTVPNQPSEASAYFMFELAKTVLVKAGGTSSTSLFKQPSNSQSHRGPHRALQMCAFQIGLYALGLNNCVSPNWLSRTYSSHVSWISNQATEIGASALSFLIDTWEGHLTPQEAASIADKASRGRDTTTIRQAARLAISCLPHAHALNPNEIQRAIVQCKEQSSSMLEGACLAIEGAAKGGGVYPEVLFSVARCWYELYETKNRLQARYANRRGGGDAPRNVSSLSSADGVCKGNNSSMNAASDLNLPPPPFPVVSSNNSLSINTFQTQQQQQQQPSMDTGPPPSIHPTMSVDVNVPSYPSSVGYGVPGLPYPLGYNYIPNLSCITPQLPVQMYIQPPASFNGAQGGGGLAQPLIPPPPPLQSLQYFPPVSIPSTLAQGVNLCHTGQQNMAPPPIPAQNQSSQSNLPPCSVPCTGIVPPGSVPIQQGFCPLPYSAPMPTGGFLGGGPPSQHGPPHHPAAALLPFVRTPPLSQHQPQMPPPPVTSQPQQQVRGALIGGQQQQQQQQQHIVANSCSMHYLLSAYRAGMLAMETLARRVQDDRPQAKYARNPAYGEDVKWLLHVALKLGTHYLHQFCLCSVNSIVSPFILYDLSIEIASFHARNSTALYHQHLRSPILQPLVQKCQQMFIQCTQLKMYYITPGDYDEFVSIVRAARAAFQMTPGGLLQFNELLQALRRSKCCKKELWQRITSALQQQPTGV